MQTPVNRFKQALQEKRTQYGLWCSLLGPLNTEICAAAGFDWLLLDAEHTPNDPMNLLQQSQIIAAYPGTHAVARVPMGHGYVGQALIKQYLDVGIQTILVPMVDTPEQAAQLVQATRYPPDGIRGMGSALARASRWQAYPQYIHEANDQVCLLVQAETALAMKNIDAIAATPGIDGVFIGPADLSASMGYSGQPGHPEVQAAIEDGIARILKAGKAPGILATTHEQTEKWLAAGARFVAVGIDTMLLTGACRQLAARYKGKSDRASAKPTVAGY